MCTDMTVLDEAFLARLLVVEKKRQQCGERCSESGACFPATGNKKSRLLTAMPLSWVDPGEINGEHLT